MKNLTAYQRARIKLAATNAKKLAEEQSQTASTEHPSNPPASEKRRLGEPE